MFLKSELKCGFTFFIEEKDSTVLKLRTVEGKIRNTVLLFISHSHGFHLIAGKDSVTVNLTATNGKIRNTVLLFTSHKVAGTRSLVLPYRKEKIQMPSIWRRLIGKMRNTRWTWCQKRHYGHLKKASDLRFYLLYRRERFSCPQSKDNWRQKIRNTLLLSPSHKARVVPFLRWPLWPTKCLISETFGMFAKCFINETFELTFL